MMSDETALLLAAIEGLQKIKSANSVDDLSFIDPTKNHPKIKKEDEKTTSIPLKTSLSTRNESPKNQNFDNAEVLLSEMLDTAYNREEYFKNVQKLFSTGKQTNISHIASLSFAEKLFLLLQYDTSGTVEWFSNGQSFCISDKEKFMKDVIPKYFKQTDFRHFERQLNVYGFGRFRADKSKYCYRHNVFHRDHPEIVSSMLRKPPRFKRGADKRTIEKSLKQQALTISSDSLDPSQQQQQDHCEGEEGADLKGSSRDGGSDQGQEDGEEEEDNRAKKRQRLD